MNRMRQEILTAALAPLTADAGVARQQFRFGPAFAGFAGHFPGSPILPAIVQVLTAVVVAEEAFRRDGPAGWQLVGIENAKFLMQVRPDHEVSVECQLLPPAGDRRVSKCRLTVGDKVAASFQLTFAAVAEAG